MLKEICRLTAILGGTAFAAAYTAKYLLRQKRWFDWKGKRVIVTGGSRGLGLEIARALVDQGAKVAICSRSKEDLDVAKRELSDRDAHVLASTCDVRDRNAVEAFVGEVAKAFGGVDVLINNAGIIDVGPWESMSQDDFRSTSDTNCWACLSTISAVVPFMRRQGWGRILNISSIGGQLSVPHLVPYSTSKFALVGLSTGLRAELARENILVVTACPGLMRTGSPRNATFRGDTEKEYAWFSISDSLPILSIDSTTAARRLLRGCQGGDPLISLSGPFNLPNTLSRLAPGLSIEAMSVINRFLPNNRNLRQRKAKGFESQSTLSPSFLTALGDAAAIRNNEI